MGYKVKRFRLSIEEREFGERSSDKDIFNQCEEICKEMMKCMELYDDPIDNKNLAHWLDKASSFSAKRLSSRFPNSSVFAQCQVKGYENGTLFQ